jgi:hypothetical protein
MHDGEMGRGSARRREVALLTGVPVEGDRLMLQFRASGLGGMAERDSTPNVIQVKIICFRTSNIAHNSMGKA